MQQKLNYVQLCEIWSLKETNDKTGNTVNNLRIKHLPVSGELIPEPSLPSCP